jgi:rubredoxin
MKELVRCRPCGFVMEASKLGDVCPACRLPRKVFEPFREKVSSNRLILLNFDLHPIAIHLTQSLVIVIPLLVIVTNFFNHFHPEMLKSVLVFSVYTFPFTLILAFVSGIIDGITRFKTLRTPLLRIKIIFSLVILSLSVILFFVAPREHYGIMTLLVSMACLAAAVQLGLWGKKLINVILPGTYPQKKGNKVSQPEEVAS